MGHGNLERTHHLKRALPYLGAGFTIKALFDDHVGSRCHRPQDRQSGLGSQEQKPLWGGVMTTNDLVFWGTPEAT